MVHSRRQGLQFRLCQSSRWFLGLREVNYRQVISSLSGLFIFLVGRRFDRFRELLCPCTSVQGISIFPTRGDLTQYIIRVSERIVVRARGSSSRQVSLSAALGRAVLTKGRRNSYGLDQVRFLAYQAIESVMVTHVRMDQVPYVVRRVLSRSTTERGPLQVRVRPLSVAIRCQYLNLNETASGLRHGHVLLVCNVGVGE